MSNQHHVTSYAFRQFKKNQGRFFNVYWVHQLGGAYIYSAAKKALDPENAWDLVSSRIDRKRIPMVARNQSTEQLKLYSDVNRSALLVALVANLEAYIKDFTVLWIYCQGLIDGRLEIFSSGKVVLEKIDNIFSIKALVDCIEELYGITIGIHKDGNSFKSYINEIHDYRCFFAHTGGIPSGIRKRRSSIRFDFNEEVRLPERKFLLYAEVIFSLAEIIEFSIDDEKKKNNDPLLFLKVLKNNNHLPPKKIVLRHLHDHGFQPLGRERKRWILQKIYDV